MTPEAMKQAAAQGSPADIFAISYLQLCQISYFKPEEIATAVGSMPPPGEMAPNPAIGNWSVVWGPAKDWDDSNLAYAAAYIDAPTGLPVLLAVCIRGTDVNVGDPWGILKQIFEDLDVPKQVALPWAPDDPARIADGTLSALKVIEGLSWENQSLSEFVTGYLGDPANQTPVLVVTGHSLGGCLTTVAAPWLQNLLQTAGVPAPIVPATFAAPTAGNADFATLFQSSFSYAPRYWNAMDIVPRAWWDLTGIETIYQPCNLTPPWEVQDGLSYFESKLQGVSYVQPAEDSTELPGACDSSAGDWIDQAGIQHSTVTYMNMLGGVNILPPHSIPPIVMYKPRG